MSNWTTIKSAADALPWVGKHCEIRNIGKGKVTCVTSSSHGENTFQTLDFEQNQTQTISLGSGGGCEIREAQVWREIETVADAVALVGKRVVLRQDPAVTTCEMKVTLVRVREDSFELCSLHCDCEIDSVDGKIEVLE